MKNIKSLLTLLLALACIFSFVACAPTETPDNTDNGTKTEDTTVPDNTDNEPEVTGLWATATYLTDTELGEGAKTITVQVKAEDKTVTFTVNTDKDTVGAALLENGLIAGDEGAYGLYVKTVNGILADYDVDQSYWGFFINGEYAMTGVDVTNITEGAVYQLERVK